MNTRRNFLKLAGSCIAGLPFVSSCGTNYTLSKEKRPNIIIIYIDDLALGDVGAFGCPDFSTKNIDALAASGIKLTNAYTINVPCSPSRSGMMMGMYTQRFGKNDLSRGVPIPDDKPTMAETLRDAGYITGFVGTEKWDIGRWDQGALDRGFMEMGMHPPRVEGHEYFGGGSSYIGVDGSYLTEVEGRYAVEFIERRGRQDKPFFLYFTPLAVHIPNTEVSKKYLKRLYPDHTGDKYSKRQYLGATLLALDDQIGLVLEKIRELGIQEETLIMFSSDNGGDPKAGSRPSPYRGGKGGANMQWEGNFRMPTIVSFPGTLPAGKSYKGMASTIDFYATAAAAAAAKLPDHCEGKDLLPLLLGDKKPNPDESLFWHTHKVQAARWRDWRILKYRDEKNWRLYDIEKDPAETSDISDKYPDVVKKMSRQYSDWIGQMPEPLAPVKPPQELLEHTVNGNHARRPFGRGWMNVEQWDKIKDDPVQWSEFHVRRRMMQQ
ncbi:Arylsulfatase [Limihaloglobus sulfuriphilus]|uniref:Arylsulfatase n=1 Tax=Limihaloglobus sulfuriphilus TaxID=1851148 RepID=A0A1Q2MHS0_9BACT|nr:sulfatase-like hydrolase/transferase [Limihaloglobus sulfuriphilus]AQQ72199.1 Arylsulfatase [Limihaloglobus sulfuriphilus]